MSTDNLDIKLNCNSSGQTIVTHQYTTHPLRLSGVFRLDTMDPRTAYLYLINTSPGLLAGDNLSLSLQLEKGTSVYLTDQAAIKVHAMPMIATKANTNIKIKVEAGARLELVAEPIILFADAALEQTTYIQLHSRAELFWSEIILPGRLARGEWYEFRYYFSQLEITSMTEEVCFRDAIHLEGKQNIFKHRDLFAAKPVLANLIVVQPYSDLEVLSQKLENLEAANCPDLLLGSSILPNNKGLLVRALASKTPQIKKYIKYALNCVRNLTNRSSLPYISIRN
ncbi:MAG: urease accessory protein UreD [Trichodesmium sp. MAG_R02]|jgi:urease accessory protein|nr:urease accessory protein UreD [Trichodesmium sp. MAG_R02]